MAPRWQATPRRPVRGILALLDRAELAWDRLDGTLWHAARCPACRQPGLYINDDRGRVAVACWSECGPAAIVAALEAAVRTEVVSS